MLVLCNSISSVHWRTSAVVLRVLVGVENIDFLQKQLMQDLNIS